jgi:hypothetical protein
MQIVHHASCVLKITDIVVQKSECMSDSFERLEVYTAEIT